MQMTLTLGRKQDLVLTFQVEHNPLASLWLERMSKRHAYQVDDRERFYGFGTLADQQSRASALIEECISTINSYDNIIARPTCQYHDQDFLNYLHHVFETYHGQLDQQTHDWWLLAPDSVRKSLARLNIAVHRYESLRKNRPRLVCTWWDMPKDKTLDPALQQQWGRVGREFGGVYLNYCEIGKTMIDLARDNDCYVGDNMFLPFNHYSADFVVSFYDTTADEIASNQRLIDHYWSDRRDFFESQGVTSSRHWKAQPLDFKVAQLICSTEDKCRIVEEITTRQWVEKISIDASRDHNHT
jgi:hypothetical protein